jgi:YHS domain-containing protein
MCGLPCVFPTPENPSIQCSMYDEKAYWFCSNGCKWIFDHEPFRYAHRVTMDRELNGLDVPEIRARMGLEKGAGGLLPAELDV